MRRELAAARVPDGGAELVDLDVAPAIRVVGVEEVVAPEVGIEGDRQKAALAPGRHPAADVEERLGLHVAAIEDLDVPRCSTT